MEQWSPPAEQIISHRLPLIRASGPGDLVTDPGWLSLWVAILLGVTPIVIWLVKRHRKPREEERARRSADRAQVTDALRFLERRRVLSDPMIYELKDEALQSVSEIRSRLAQALGSLSDKSEAAEALTRMSRSAEDFMRRSHDMSMKALQTPLQEMRTDFDRQMRTLARIYGIEPGQRTWDDN